MKKPQSPFVLILLVIIAVAIAVLAAGIVGLQKLMTLSRTAHKEYTQKFEECEMIKAELDKRPAWETMRNDLDLKLATLDQNMVDYEYLPTYLAQVQRTAVRTGNLISSLRPRPVEPLDAGSPLIKASRERWTHNHPEVVAATKATAPSTEEASAAPAADPTRPAEEYRLQQYSLDIVGDYVSLMRFLSALRTFPKMVYVHSINLTPTQADTGTPLRIRMETYAIITPDQYTPATAAESAAGGQRP